MGAGSAIAVARTHPAAEEQRGRLAVSLIFAVHGVISGTFAARTPWIQTNIHASTGVLGAVMITPTLGALAVMPAISRVVHHFGARTGMRILVALFCVTLIPLALVSDAWSLAALMFLNGAAAGAADVAMNAHAVRIERRLGRSIMSGFHGLWAVGMISGSALGGLCAGAGIGAPAEFAATAVGSLVLGVAACNLLPPDDPAAADIAPPRYALPSRAILGIGLVGFCGIWAEGASSSWCAVYLIKVAHATAALGAYSLTGFSVTMAVGRLTGDAITRRLGPVTTVRAGGILAVAGACLVALATGQVLCIVGFAAIGLGIATSVPLAFTAAGRFGGDTEGSVAGVATIMYGAGLIAGPAVGALGSTVSLPFAFWVTAVVTAGLVLGANALRAA
ncbi:MAG TPA: MFS transporter [Actinocrinis sp.]|uniref:MFS transporter n=1 Tax=Actinocrinis sp. TaxID=1920516 RepID=UPI002DDD2F1A|nr:MFS transporter [Actinocrinis sp.]HEV2344064.1 MFS transporter [Actinocrinis sp.]